MLQTEGNAGDVAAFDTSSISGVQNLTVNSAGGSVDNVKAASTTAITVNHQADGGSVSTTGGAAVNVTTAGGNVTVTGAAGAVTVNDADSGLVTVKNAGGVVAINGVADSVAVTNAASDVTITETAPASGVSVGGTVNVNGVKGTLTISDANADVISIANATGAAINVTGSAASVTIGSLTTNADGSQTLTGAASDTTAINVSEAGTGTTAIFGGSTVSVTEAKDGTVNVQGGTGTTSVSVAAGAILKPAQDGTFENAATVTISDVANLTVAPGATAAAATIASVTLSGLEQATINSNALTSVSVSNNASGSVTVTNATKGAQSLSVNLNNVGYSTTNVATGATVANKFTFTDATATSVAITTSGAASIVDTLAIADATSITIAGDQALKIGTLTAALGDAVTGKGGLASVVATGAGGVSADFSAYDKSLATIDFSGETGNNTVTLGGHEAYKGGAGNDFVTIDAIPTAAISGGAGANEIVLGFDGSNSAAVGKLITGFQTLGFDTTSAGSFDLSQFAGVTAVDLKDGANVTLDHVAANTTVTLEGNATLVYNLDDASSTKDVLSIAYGTASVDGGYTANVKADGVENVTINSIGSNAAAIADAKVAPNANTLTLDDTSAVSLTLSGTESLVLNDAATTHLTSIDATGFAKGLTVDLTNVAAVTTGLTLKGGDASFTFVGGVDGTHLAADGVTVLHNLDTITLGNGANTISETGSGDATITLGSGNNSVDLSGETSASVAKLTAGDGVNTITSGNGTSTITLGNGDNVVNLTTGVNTVTVGNGANTITLGDNANVVTAGTGTDTFNVGASINAANAATGTFNTITGAHAGDVINLAGYTAVAANADGTLGAKLTTGTNTFAQMLDLAATTTKADAVNWFQFNGNTYVVDAHVTGSAYANGDVVVKLAGAVDLSHSVISNGALHIA